MYYIDSIDIQNKWMSKKKTYKSFKLKKQSLRLTILYDNHKIPVKYSVNPAHKTDNDLGCELLIDTQLDNNITVCGDKGYITHQNKTNDRKEENRPNRPEKGI
jgi:hypothetical protein